MQGAAERAEATARLIEMKPVIIAWAGMRFCALPWAYTASYIEAVGFEHCGNDPGVAFPGSLQRLQVF
jgi:hypothetical protein